MAEQLFGNNENKPHWLDECCGNCIYFTVMRGFKKVIVTDPTPKECRRFPPAVTFSMQPVGNGQMAGGISVTFPRLSDNFPACAEFISDKPNVHPVRNLKLD